MHSSENDAVLISVREPLKGHCHEVRMRKFCSRKALPELSAAIMEVSGNILFCI